MWPLEREEAITAQWDVVFTTNGSALLVVILQGWWS